MPTKQGKTFDHMPQGFGVEWLTSQSFMLDGYKFTVPANLGDLIFNADAMAQSDEETFYMAKPVEILRNCFVLFKNRPPKHILELGLMKGGSAAFLQLLGKPSKMLALELSTERLDILDRFIEAEGLQESMHLGYGVDQGDAETVRDLCARYLGEGRSIDLVLDDASHLLRPTRASFEAAFPYIRPHGSYVIEDFATLPIMLNPWLDKAAEHDGYKELVELALRDFLEEDRRPLHSIAMEATLGCIADPGIIDRVEINKHWLRIVRGSKAIENPESFDLRAMAIDHFGVTDSSPMELLNPYFTSG